MKFEKKYQPDLIASTDETRSLHCVELDVTQRRMMATDGHRGIIIPCEPEDGDTSGAIDTATLKAARKAAGRREVLAGVTGNGTTVVDLKGNVMTFQRPTPPSPFPPLDKVIPDLPIGADGTFSISFNARYLYELALAMGAAKCITITAKVSDPQNPIVVRPDAYNSAVGVLMPTSDDRIPKRAGAKPKV